MIRKRVKGTMYKAASCPELEPDFYSSKWPFIPIPTEDINCEKDMWQPNEVDLSQHEQKPLYTQGQRNFSYDIEGMHLSMQAPTYKCDLNPAFLPPQQDRCVPFSDNGISEKLLMPCADMFKTKFGDEKSCVDKRNGQIPVKQQFDMNSSASFAVNYQKGINPVYVQKHHGCIEEHLDSLTYQAIPRQYDRNSADGNKSSGLHYDGYSGFSRRHGNFTNGDKSLQLRKRNKYAVDNLTRDELSDISSFFRQI